jgi:hypothetical protein
MKTAEKYEEVWYPVSTYVWCEGESKLLGRHPIFVSSPVRFTRLPSSRITLLTCSDRSCSLYGEPTRYSEEEIRCQDGYVLRRPCLEAEVKQ